MPFVPGVADEVPDHQEVAGEAHLLDDLDLVLQALAVDLVVMARPARRRRRLRSSARRSSSPSRATFSK